MGAQPPFIKTTAAARRSRAWMIYLKKVPHEPRLLSRPPRLSPSTLFFQFRQFFALPSLPVTALVASFPLLFHLQPQSPTLSPQRFLREILSILYLILLKRPLEWTYFGRLTEKVCFSFFHFVGLLCSCHRKGIAFAVLCRRTFEHE